MIGTSRVVVARMPGEVHPQVLARRLLQSGVGLVVERQGRLCFIGGSPPGWVPPSCRSGPADASGSVARRHDRLSTRLRCGAAGVRATDSVGRMASREDRRPGLPQRARLRRPHPSARATASPSPDGRVVAVVPERRPRRVRRARRRGRRPRRRRRAARLPGRPRAPGAGRRRADALRPHRAGARRGSTSPRSAPTSRRTRTAPWVLGRRLGDAGVRARPGRRAADLDAVVGDRPVFLPNRDHHGAWVNSRGAAARRHRPRAPPTRPTAASSATPPARRPARCTRARWRSCSGTCRRPRDEEHDAGLLRGAGLPALAGRHRLAGRDPRGLRRQRRPGARRTCGPSSAGTLTARVRGALWWERDAGLEQVERLVERRATYTVGRLDAGLGQGHAGRGRGELHGRRCRAPYRDGCGGAHRTTAGCRSSTPQVLRDAVTRLDAEGFQVHVHAIGDRGRRARRSTRSRRPARRTAGPAGGTTSRTSRSSRPRDRAAVRRARRDREHAGAVGRQRRGDDRDDAAVPRRGAGRLAVPVRRRSPAPGPGWRRAATGRSARPTRWPRSTSR